jgi:hypothetical protein
MALSRADVLTGPEFVLLLLLAIAVLILLALAILIAIAIVVIAGSRRSLAGLSHPAEFRLCLGFLGGGRVTVGRTSGRPAPSAICVICGVLARQYARVDRALSI